MCLDITKQYYVFLLSLKEAEPNGLNWIQMSEKMKALSTRFFGRAVYASFPAPLFPMIKESKEIGEIIGEGNNYRISKYGESNLDFIEKNFVKPSLKSNAPKLTQA